MLVCIQLNSDATLVSDFLCHIFMNEVDQRNSSEKISLDIYMYPNYILYLLPWSKFNESLLNAFQGVILFTLFWHVLGGGGGGVGDTYLVNTAKATFANQIPFGEVVCSINQLGQSELECLCYDRRKIFETLKTIYLALQNSATFHKHTDVVSDHHFSI